MVDRPRSFNIKVSPACEACNVKKIKCDRGFPVCNTCLKRGTRCKYNFEKYSNSAAKDQIIFDLEREVEYWRSKSLGVRELLVDPCPSEKTESANKRGKFGVSNSKSEEPTISETISHIHEAQKDDVIDFYEAFSSLTITNWVKQEINPFSIRAPMHKDIFLSLLVSSIATGCYKDALLHSMDSGSYSLKSNDAKVLKKLLSLNPCILQTATEAQKQRVQQFLNMLHESDASDAVSDYLDCQFDSEDKSFFFEDSSLNLEYSNTLANAVERLEELLPPYPIISVYMRNFYQEIYPFHPFVEVSLFEEAISNVIHPDPTDSSKVKIRLGQLGLRSKMMNLFLLILLLKLSEMSLDLALSNLEPASISGGDTVLLETVRQHPIKSELLYFSFGCLMHLNIFQWTNETVVCYYLYLWVLFTFNPERQDTFIDQTSESIVGVASLLANEIGLSKDPSEYEQFINSFSVDLRLFNFRRKLWIGVASICRSEVIFKGRPPQCTGNAISSAMDISVDGLDKYTRLFEKDMLIEDPLELYFQTKAFHRYECLLRLQILDKISTETDGGMKLSEFSQLLDVIDDVSSDMFSIKELYSISSASRVKFAQTTYTDVSVDTTKIENVHRLQAHMLLSSVSLVLKHLLMLYFEQKVEDFRVTSPEHCGICFSEVLVNLMKLSGVLADYFKGRFDAAISKYSKISLGKVAQIVLTRVFFIFLGLILRLEHAEHVLGERLKMETALLRQPLATSQPDGCKQRIELIVGIRKRLENTLMSICDLGSQELRFQYLFTFKLFLLFDYVIHLIKKGELFKAFARILDPESQKESNLGEDFFLNTFLTQGIDLSRSKEIRETLFNSNFLVSSDVRVLKTIREKMGESCPFKTDHRGQTEFEQQFADCKTPRDLCTIKSRSKSDVHIGSSVHASPAPSTHDFTGAGRLDASSFSIDDLGMLDYEFLFKYTH